MVPGRFSWFFMILVRFSWFFHGSKLVSHGAMSTFMVFDGSRFFIFHVENTLKLYSGPTIQSRPCWPWAGFALVYKIHEHITFPYTNIRIIY